MGPPVPSERQRQRARFVWRRSSSGTSLPWYGGGAWPPSAISLFFSPLLLLLVATVTVGGPQVMMR